MAPIYESDVAEERYAQTAWENYELWEKIEIRLRRQRRLWILGTVVLFLILSAIPIVRERAPAWHSLQASRELAQAIGQLKLAAATTTGTLRLRFTDATTLDYVVEKVSTCEDGQGELVHRGRLLKHQSSPEVQQLSALQAGELGIPGVIDSFCFDSLKGQIGAKPSEVPSAGMAFAPVKDLAEHRADRFSILLLSGPSAEISFD